MATTETDLGSKTETTTAAAAPVVKVVSKKGDSFLDKMLGLLSSVRFGVSMLGILLIFCMIGMLIVQVTVTEPDGAFNKYYASLSASQKMVYGELGFFDIYRSRYFMLLLAIVALNIILASIDRFPAAWQYIRKPKLNASPKFIAAQMFTDESYEHHAPPTVAEKVSAAWKKHGFRARVSTENNRTTVFAQRHVYNRLGAYIVHVALLTIFTGGMLTSRLSTGGPMEIRPGKSSDKYTTFDVTLDGGPRQTDAVLPFQIECRDLQQMLIRPEGSLDAGNTIDWLSYITIKDGPVRKDLLVHLNNVGDYQGYRFFQSQFMPVGNAREITVSFEPEDGSAPSLEPVKIMRNGSADVPGIGTVRYIGFYADFEIDDSGPVTKSREYNNPAAQLEVIGADGKRNSAFAFNPQLADEYLSKANNKLAKDGGANPLLVNGNKVILTSFEKVSSSHTLTIQYDPGRVPVYIGFTLLVLALCFVFFLSHQRVWAVIEPDGQGSKIYFGGNTNRNRPAFEGRFNLLVQSVTGRIKNE
ncbi:MAG: cytochrome c biogenesis protein ResB [Acidobacteriota bacterium]